MHWRRVAVSVLVAAVVLAVFFFGVDWRQVFTTIGDAEPTMLALALVASLGILGLRGAVLRRLLVLVDDSARGSGFVTAFLSGVFARNALPWGGATSVPVTAYVLSRNSQSRFDDNVAVVVTAELFGFVASIVVVLIGVAMLVWEGGVPWRIQASIGVAGVAVLLVGAMVLAVVRRGPSRVVLVGVATRWGVVIDRVPYGSAARSSARERVAQFFATLELVRRDQHTVLIAFALALTGWIVAALPLYFSLLAIGVGVPFSVALVCVPIALLAAIVPLPGGTGGVEITLGVLLVLLGDLSPATAAAGAILYRVTVYLFHLGIGGAGVVYLSVGSDRPVSG